MVNEIDPADQELFRQTVGNWSPQVRRYMLLRLGVSIKDPNLSDHDYQVMKRCIEILREFNGPS